MPAIHENRESDFESLNAPKLSFVMIRATDMKRSCDFYSLIGFAFEEHKHNEGSLHFAGSISGLTLEVYPASEGLSPLNAVRLGFEVSDISRVKNNFLAANYTLLVDVEDSPWGKRMVILDPDENRVEFYEKKTT